jgi:F0F1-type ATP synthase delta subunit
MAENVTLARPYAEALFRAGVGAAEVEQMSALADTPEKRRQVAMTL